jgi:poly(glycerol-phosphate) alpha-glucosyltransferase
MIPNGVDLPPETGEGQWSEPGRRRFEIDDQRTLLFLGRIHPKKGLSELVEGWRISQARHNGWVLEIAGWDSGGHEPGLRDRIARWGLECSVKCVGSLFGECKERALRRASAFILPSLSEGLPMAVLEAWSYAKPVLITPQCNLPEGFAADAAIQIESNSESIAGALDHLIRMTDDEIAEMGRRGRRLVEQSLCVAEGRRSDDGSP